MKSKILLTTMLLTAFCIFASAQQKKPNIVIIWGDDIGNSVGNRTWVVGDKYGILCFSK